MNAHLLPALGAAVFPFGAPDTCEMVLSRGLGTQRRVLLGRAHCSQLELRLHTVIFIPKSQEALATLGLGRPAFLRQACLNQHSVPNSPALALEAWILFLVWILMGRSLGNRWVGYQHPSSEKERSLQPTACKLEALVSANLLRAPWFLPKETRRDASSRTNRLLEGLVWTDLTFRREARSSRELRCCGV